MTMSSHELYSDTTAKFDFIFEFEVFFFFLSKMNCCSSLLPFRRVLNVTSTSSILLDNP